MGQPFYLGEDCRDFWEASVKWFKAAGMSSAYPADAGEILWRLERESRERLALAQAACTLEKTDAVATSAPLAAALEQLPEQDDVEWEPSPNEETSEAALPQPTPPERPQGDPAAPVVESSPAVAPVVALTRYLGQASMEVRSDVALQQAQQQKQPQQPQSQPRATTASRLRRAVARTEPTWELRQKTVGVIDLG